MDIYSYIIIAGFALALIIGFALGLGRSLNIFITGVFGVIIAIVLCFAFGGAVAKIPQVGDWIAQLNDYLMSKSEFLGKIKLATIIYYIVLFLVFQIIRFILAKIIKKVFGLSKGESVGSKAWNVINRLLSTLFMGGMYIVLVFLALSVVSLFSDTQGIANTLTKCSTEYKFSLFYKMYQNNPIDLRKLFGMAKDAFSNVATQTETAAVIIKGLISLHA